jgi:hypothetical protein
VIRLGEFPLWPRPPSKSINQHLADYRLFGCPVRLLRLPPLPPSSPAPQVEPKNRRTKEPDNRATRAVGPGA